MITTVIWLKIRRMYKTPILFLIFNRPDLTKRVFNEIKKVKPAKLYIAADGSRLDRLGEIELCQLTRNVTEVIDWDCDVRRLYRTKNLGCRKAVSSAIDWFFKNETGGVILEDDCLPNTSFFTFCQKMLRLYEKDEKVMHIGGSNFQRRKSDDYYFSKYVHVWGWATWRRVWKSYDVNIKNWPEIKNSEILKGYYSNNTEKLFWETMFDAVYRKKIDTWDYQYVYNIWRNGGISVIPGKNTISNIGFRSDAVHTKSNNSSLSNLNVYKLSISPKKRLPNINKKADDYTRKNILNINILNVLKQKSYFLMKSKNEKNI